MTNTRRGFLTLPVRLTRNSHALPQVHAAHGLKSRTVQSAPPTPGRPAARAKVSRDRACEIAVLAAGRSLKCREMFPRQKLKIPRLVAAPRAQNRNPRQNKTKA